MLVFANRRYLSVNEISCTDKCQKVNNSSFPELQKKKEKKKLAERGAKPSHTCSITNYGPYSTLACRGIEVRKTDEAPR